MAEYHVTLAASAVKELHDLPPRNVARIVIQLQALASVPRPSGCKKLKGGDKEYRIRIGDYRVIYVLDDARRTIDVTRIAHRRDVYR